jgi:alpha-L-arabinofuranosidase
MMAPLRRKLASFGILLGLGPSLLAGQVHLSGVLDHGSGIERAVRNAKNMENIKSTTCLLVALLLAPLAALRAEDASGKLTVKVDQPGAKISRTLYGIFFEDINFGADGGLYPELVKNRSFEFPKPLTGWTEIRPADAKGLLTILDKDPASSTNPHYLRITAEAGEFGVADEGFRGMGVRAGEVYDFSAQIRASGVTALRVELAAADGRVLALAKLDGLADKWLKHTATLRPTATEAKAHLNLIVEGRGTLDLDAVSLFPKATYKNRPNGLRADLVQMLADLKPGFMRFPGGCIVEGDSLANRYQWKSTIGKLEDRKGIPDLWSAFEAHPTPDYFQSYGLGFYEYFQLCEDIGAEPLPLLNCGMACQFRSTEMVPLTELDPYIQDALDLIEFANGSAESPWGAKRAAMGHPEPFRMKYLGVGNEQWGQAYIDRYKRFAAVLKAKHPEIKLVSSGSASPSGAQFDFAWKELRALNADIVDEHVYSNPRWFRDGATRFDHYSRTGPKVFMGEYAVRNGVKPNCLEGAIAEAAFMTGLERNADVVVMSSYAPLFANVNAFQWNPNLIWFDNLRVVGTPNYYVQKMFAENRGDAVLPVEVIPQAVNRLAGAAKPLYATASRDEKSGEVIIKMVNVSNQEQELEVQLQGVAKTQGEGVLEVLTGNPGDINTLAEPNKVVPQTRHIPVAPKFRQTFPANSVSVLRVKTNL